MVEGFAYPPDPDNTQQGHMHVHLFKIQTVYLLKITLSNVRSHFCYSMTSFLLAKLEFMFLVLH